MVKVKVKLLKEKATVTVFDENKNPVEKETIRYKVDFPYGYILREINEKKGYAIIELIRNDVYEKFKDKVLEVISE